MDALRAAKQGYEGILDLQLTKLGFKAFGKFLISKIFLY